MFYPHKISRTIVILETRPLLLNQSDSVV